MLRRQRIVVREHQEHFEGFIRSGNGFKVNEPTFIDPVPGWRLRVITPSTIKLEDSETRQGSNRFPHVIPDIVFRWLAVLWRDVDLPSDNPQSPDNATPGRRQICDKEVELGTQCNLECILRIQDVDRFRVTATLHISNWI
jgi:hypothetical protein